MDFENKITIIPIQERTLCRVCLSSDQNNQCIFPTGQDDRTRTKNYDLSIKLRLCCNVEVSKEDGLPITICMACTVKLNAAYELREQCQKSDLELHKLYGKSKRRNHKYVTDAVKDQYCQTESYLSQSLIKREEDSFKGYNKIIEDGTSSCGNLNHVTVGINSCQIAYNDSKKINVEKQNAPVEMTEVEPETLVVKREPYRTRRLTVFKRVTSMENLKNHKDRQRQYIKKNVNAKRESVENDIQKNNESLCKADDRIPNTNSDHSYECLECNRFYSSKKSLDRHALTHSDRNFPRETFEKLFKRGKLRETKIKSKEVICAICHKSFRKTDTMVRHLNVHKRANPREVFSILKEIRDKRKTENIVGHVIPDNYMDSSSKHNNREDKKTLSNTNDYAKEFNNFLDAETCNEHLSSSDSNSESKSNFLAPVPLYKCKQCTKCYTTERSLQRHTLIHNEKKFTCNVCNMKFFRQDRLKSHRNRYGHNEGTPCLEPQKPPDDKSAIKLINSWIREELDSDNEGKGFPCKICGKSYDTKKSLSKHQVNVHTAAQACCTSCGSVCICSEKCKNQDKTNEKSKPYTCDECNKSFEKEIKLQRHLRIHERAKEQQDSNFKRFLCHICSKTFRQNTGLMFHMRTHTGYKPHVCKYCGRGFTSNSNCINHERTHTGDRPFVCHFCSAAFAKSCTLKAHITTHTGEANYHCKTCGKSFRRLKYLKEHRFTHTGEKPYACKICGTAYSHSGSLFVHEKKCKAQYNSYQSSTVQNTQNYCESQTDIPNPASVIASIVTILKQI